MILNSFISFQASTDTIIINWSTILTASTPFIIVIIIKILLDFNLAKLVVRLFYWLPVRNYFRSKPHKISGEWEEHWELEGTKSFKDPNKRHSHPRIKQLDRYCFAEFIANGKTYYVFGKVINDYFIGEWHDVNDPLGYFGTFHLLISDSDTMKGKWIGHSKEIHSVREGNWNWNKRKQ